MSVAADVSIATDVSTDMSAVDDANMLQGDGGVEDEGKNCASVIMCTPDSKTLLSNPCGNDMLSSSVVSEQDEGCEESWSPQIGDVKKVNKRRSDIINKNTDIITKIRQSAGGVDDDNAEQTFRGTRFYSATDTEHIASQLDALQEEQIAALQAQLRQEKLARTASEEKELATTKEVAELQLKIRQLEDNLTRARDTATDKKAAQKLRKLLEQQENAIEMLCQHVEAHQVMASLTDAGLSHGETTAEGAVAAASRHSLEIMSTLFEENEDELDGCATPGKSRDNSMAGRNLMMLINLRKEVARVREESEELRQTADCCFVREQEAKHRCEELEAENRELQNFTEQMAETHSKLTQGVMELQSRQEAMVSQETYEEALAEIEQLKCDQLSMVPNLNALLEEIETLKAAALNGSGVEQIQEIRSERDAHATACSELRVHNDSLQTEIEKLRKTVADKELFEDKCKKITLERDEKIAACAEYECKIISLQSEIENLREAAVEHAQAAQDALSTVQQLQRQASLAEKAQEECDQLREQLEVLENSTASSQLPSDYEELKTQLSTAKMQIAELESDAQARHEESRTRTKETYDEMMAKREHEYHEQYAYLKQRVETLEKDREEAERDRDEALKDVTELEAVLELQETEHSAALQQRSFGWLRFCSVALLLFFIFVIVAPALSVRGRRVPLLL